MWLYPSRGRPAACERLLASMIAHGMAGPGVVAVNADDADRPAYERLALPPGWRLMLVPVGTVGFCEGLRQGFREAPDQPWYGVICDDNGIGTQGFEQRLVSAAGRWGIASGNDDWQASADIDAGRMQGAIVFGGDLIRALGWLLPDGFRHLYADNVWETIGRELGNWRTLMQVMTPHDHPFKTGGALDATHAAVNTPAMYADDADRFRRWLAEESVADIDRARLALWAAQGLSLDRARRRSVMLAFPVYDRPHHRHEAAAMETVGLLSRLGIHHGFCHVHGQPVHTARNLLVNAFLDSVFTDLLFIDADMAWRPWDAVRLLAHPHPLIGGVGRKRNALPDTDPRAWCFSPLTGDDGPNDGTVPHDAAGAFEVRHLGTGFLLINRSVFLDLERRGAPDRVADADGAAHTRFFRWDFADGAEIGEDYAFCRDYRAVGGRVMADPSIELSHVGTAEHRARLLTLLS